MIRSISNNPVRRLEKKCDALWQQTIVAMFNGRCSRCLMPAACVHHLHGCAFKAQRHQILNGLAHCDSCHADAHSEIDEYKAWVRDRFPAHWENYSTANAQPSIQYNIAWLNRQRDSLREIKATLNHD